MKSEPDVFSLNDLKTKKTSLWDGVRNYTARNYMMKDMKVGDTVLFYHSSSDPSGIAGLAEVIGPARPDPSQFDPKSEYYDPKSTQEKPRWYCVEVGYRETWPFLSLPDLKANKKLKDMMLFHYSRLSVQPVSQAHFKIISKIIHSMAKGES